MTSARQQVLVLHLNDEPPYSSVLDAMRDGWRVFQASPLPERSAAAGTGQLANEYWLERIQDNDSHEGG